MAEWSASNLALLQGGEGIKIRWALRCYAKNFAGDPVTVKLWTGIVAQQFTLDGSVFTFQPIGDSLEIGPIRYTMGTQIGYLDLGLQLTEDGEQFVRGLDTRLAPAYLHCILFDPSNSIPVGARRYWKGFVDALTISTPEPGEPAVASIKLASSARMGTLSVAGKKSDSSQRQRDRADRIRKYGDLGSKPNDPWGTSDD